jgi:phosphorylase kinase alpha/beta subunit
MVPKESISAERNTSIQVRVANENVPLVWAQSLKIVGDMIDTGLVMLRISSSWGRNLARLSHKRGSDVVVQVVLLAENAELQAQMALAVLILKLGRELCTSPISHSICS